MMDMINDIWYATNIEIVDYMKAARNLKFTVEGILAVSYTHLTLPTIA